MKKNGVTHGCLSALTKRLAGMLIGLIAECGMAGAQTTVVTESAPTDSVHVAMPAATSDFSDQRDILYYAHRLFPRIQFKNRDSVAMPTGRLFAWILPSISYEPQTRLAAYLGGNVAFRTGGANVSSIYPTLAYTQNKQLFFHTTANLWFPNNRYNITTDWRAMYYPQLTYGLGGYTTTRNAVLLSYNYVRLYQTLTRAVGRNLYIGGGYNLDYHWNIRATETTGDAISTSGYDLNQLGKSVSSGLTLNLVFDERSNLLNPAAGFFANVQLRSNLRLLGSDTDYQSLLIDVRKYISLPIESHNILALWSYSNLTLNGNPPYLDLPSTGWDALNNQGRGYIQSRFRSKNLIYTEGEYRFRIIRNGVLGGVAFVNTHLVSEPVTGQFARLIPAGGVGLRVKLNRLSNVNFAADFGVGTDGSRSVYFNIGEMF